MPAKAMIEAKINPNDEFFTRIKDISEEMNFYRAKEFGGNGLLEGKRIVFNCDDYKFSNFYKFFKQNPKFFKYKSLMCVGRPRSEDEHFLDDAWMAEFDGTVEKITKITLPENYFLDSEYENIVGAWDFRYTKRFINKDDVVITNPPFSVFRDFYATMKEIGCKFIVIANASCVTYKEIFPDVIKREFHNGYSNIKPAGFWFDCPDDFEIKPSKNDSIVNENGVWRMWVQGVFWYTNFETDYKKRIEYNIGAKFSDVTAEYNPNHYYGNEESYPKYDNYDAIESKSTKIPCDYFGKIGVPISFLPYLDRNVWEIISLNITNKTAELLMNGKHVYNRLIIKRK